MNCEFMVNGDYCGAEAVTECFHCGPLCKDHEKEACKSTTGHLGLDLELSAQDVKDVVG
jgi:hypothetical protein